jgi:hypothetical protein
LVSIEHQILLFLSKYSSSWGGWCSSKPVGAFGVGVWKFIRKGWDSFSSFTTVVVGDGSMISFWHVLWCGGIALKVSFPTLFGIAQAQDTYVVDKLEFLGNANQWNVSFTREAHD